MGFASPYSDAETATTLIHFWCADFGVLNGLMFDGPTHFRNKTLRFVSKGLKVPHRFTFPSTHWINGAIEDLRRELLRVIRLVMLEYKLTSRNDQT